MTEAELERAMPGVRWRDPVRITVTEDPLDRNSRVIASGFACRYCLARHGIAAAEIDGLPQTLDAFREHLERDHKITTE